MTGHEPGTVCVITWKSPTLKSPRKVGDLVTVGNLVFTWPPQDQWINDYPQMDGVLCQQTLIGERKTCWPVDWMRPLDDGLAAKEAVTGVEMV